MIARTLVSRSEERNETLHPEGPRWYPRNIIPGGTGDRTHATVVLTCEAKSAIGVLKVYFMCMSRTNIEIDDAACAKVMKRFNLKTKRDAVNFALQLVATEAMTLDEARSMRGSGWVGDLEEMRENRGL